MAPKIFRVVHALLRPVVDLREQQAPVVVSVGIIRLERTTFALQPPAHINTYTYKQTTMSNFVPTQFTSFTDNFDFDKLKTGTSSTFMSNIKSMKKVDDFFDFSRMSIPKSIFDFQQRVTYNHSYFASNYTALAFLFFLYCIFTNIPFFLFVFVELVIVYFVQKAYGNSDELSLRFFRLHRNVWYSILLTINIPVLFFCSPLSTVFWLSLITAVLVLFHAAIMDKPVDAAYSNAV